MKALLTRLAIRWLRRHSPHSLSYLIAPYTPRPRPAPPPAPEPPDVAAWVKTLQSLPMEDTE